MFNIVNPYVVGNPVTGPKMFFGRDDVFASVRANLVGEHRDNVIILSGQERTGKTSVLNNMRYHLPPHYLCIVLDMQGFALESLDGLLWELTNHIMRSLRKEYQIDLPPLNRDQFMIDPRSAFEDEFLNRVWSAIDAQHVLLMFDEAVRLQEQVQAGKLGEDIFIYLRHLMQSYERLNFLFSLGSDQEDIQHEFAYMFTVGLHMKITFLDLTSARALITEPVKDYYEIDPDALERMLQITSGHPFHTQLLCHILFNRWQRQRTAQGKVQLEIKVQDVDEVLAEAVELGLGELKYIWEKSTAGEKAVMVGMASTMGEQRRPIEVNDIRPAWRPYNVVIPEREVARSFQRLLERDVIIGRDTYIFAVDLQRLWVQKYKRLEWVKDEIAEAVQEWHLHPHEMPDVPPRPFPFPISRRAFVLGLVGLVGLAATGYVVLANYVFVDHPLVYRQHMNSVYTTGWRTNELQIASGGADNSVRVWSSTDGTTSFVYKEHKASVNALAWMPENGTFIASASADKKVLIWNPVMKQTILTYTEHTGNIRTVDWSHNALYIASAGDDGNLHVWVPFLASGRSRTIDVYAHHERIWALSWSPNDKYIAAGGNDKLVRIWDIVSGKHISPYEEHNSNVKAVSWSPDGEHIASGGDDAHVRLWSSQTGQTMRTYTEHTGAVLTIAWSPNGRYIASSGDDPVVRVWDATTGTTKYTYDGHTLAVHCVAWAKDGTRIASCSDDKTVHVWRPNLS